MKKNNRGITLVSLTMYVVAFAILAGIIATITSFFYTNVTELSDSTNSLGEFEKFNAAFLKEVKLNEAKIVNIKNGGRQISFASGTVISFEENDQGIYSNNIKICEGVKECKFSINEGSVDPAITVYIEIGKDFAKTLDYLVNTQELMYETTAGKVILTPSTTAWTASDVIVTLSYEDIPDGYELQYKIGDEWWETGTTAAIQNNNTTVKGRLYNLNTNHEIGRNSITINNIDKQKPTMPTGMEVNTSENSVTVKARGGTDELSGVAGYQYSIDNTNWSETLEPNTTYIFDNLQSGVSYTLYSRTIDNVGMASSSYVEEVALGIKVTKITIADQTLTKTGSTNPTVTITPTIAPTNATNKKVTWKSSNTSVATVNSSGVVTYVGAGTTTITCTASDGSGVSGTCTVTCSEIIKVTGITLENKTLTKTSSATTNPTVTITPTIEPSNATIKAVTWKSSNTAVATVSSSGVVTYVGIGTATITCTASDGSGVSGTCTVTCQTQDTNSYQIANYTGNRTSVEMIYGNKTIAVNLTGISKITFEYRGWTSGQTLSTKPGGGCYVRVQNATASPNYIDLRSGGGYYDAVWNTATINVTSGSASSSLYFDCWANTAPSSLYVDIGLFVRNITLIP